MKKIVGLEVLPNFRLKLIYANGRVIEINFDKKIQRGTVTEPLLDQKFFKQVKIAPSGRAIEWPDGLDFCADSLWFEGSGEKNPFLESERAS